MTNLFEKSKEMTRILKSKEESDLVYHREIERYRNRIANLARREEANPSSPETLDLIQNDVEAWIKQITVLVWARKLSFEIHDKEIEKLGMDYNFMCANKEKI